MPVPDPARTLVIRGTVGDISSVDIAQGILMERYEVGSRAAFEILLRHANDRRLPMVEIAHWLIATRRLL
ncbi:ANTAR domain-containing protein [Kribbella sp. C-35]|uniref:ANTAR domain-containing protein n=1 Tax=Kribbella sp. C-35 TaxID=2789276 RepID=UPI003977ED87